MAAHILVQRIDLGVLDHRIDVFFKDLSDLSQHGLVFEFNLESLTRKIPTQYLTIRCLKLDGNIDKEDFERVKKALQKYSPQLFDYVHA